MIPLSSLGSLLSAARFLFNLHMQVRESQDEYQCLAKHAMELERALSRQYKKRLPQDIEVQVVSLIEYESASNVYSND